MRFVVTHSCGGSGRARAGTFFAGNSPTAFETPALLLSTKKGLPAFLSCDLLASIPSSSPHLLNISPVHFLDGPTPATISSIGGLHQMLALQNCVFVASARDSIESLPECIGANKLGASFETPGGRRLVKPSDYMEVISSLKPDFWSSLSDEVPAWVTEKRNRISVDRTLRWLDDCIALARQVKLTFLELLLVDLVYENVNIVQLKRQREMCQVFTLEVLGLERAWMNALVYSIQLCDTEIAAEGTHKGFACEGCVGRGLVGDQVEPRAGSDMSHCVFRWVCKTQFCFIRVTRKLSVLFLSLVPGLVNNVLGVLQGL